MSHHLGRHGPNRAAYSPLAGIKTPSAARIISSCFLGWVCLSLWAGERMPGRLTSKTGVFLAPLGGTIWRRHSTGGVCGATRTMFIPAPTLSADRLATRLVGCREGEGLDPDSRRESRNRAVAPKFPAVLGHPTLCRALVWAMPHATPGWRTAARPLAWQPARPPPVSAGARTGTGRYLFGASPA